MLLLASYDIVFQEIPGEVTLALNLSGCPNRCPGCHSPHLQQPVGEVLDEALLAALLERYGDSVTCVGFMGGDGDPGEVNRLAGFVRRWRDGARAQGTDGADRAAVAEGAATHLPNLKTAWYSGRAELAAEVELANFDFIKLGPWDETRGSLSSPETNQRFYRVEMVDAGDADRGIGEYKMVDRTSLFRKK